jgi:hypothetical protein
MNSKKFVDEVYKILIKDKMSLFETITSVMEENDLDIDEIVEILKEEKTLLNDLKAECEAAGMLKGNNKTIDIEGLF